MGGFHFDYLTGRMRPYGDDGYPNDGEPGAYNPAADRIKQELLNKAAGSSSGEGGMLILIVFTIASLAFLVFILAVFYYTAWRLYYPLLGAAAVLTIIWWLRLRRTAHAEIPAIDTKRLRKQFYLLLAATLGLPIPLGFYGYFINPPLKVLIGRMDSFAAKPAPAKIVSSAVAMGEDAVSSLLPLATQNTNRVKRSVAFEALGKIGKPAFPALREFLADNPANPDNAATQEWALWAYSLSGKDAAGEVQLFLPFAASSNQGIRIQAMRALGAGEVEHPDVVAALAQGCRDTNRDVQFYAVEGLMKIAPRQAGHLVPQLVYFAGFDSPLGYVACEALAAMARKDPSLLSTRLQFPNEFAEWRIIEAIGRLGESAVELGPIIESRFKSRYRSVQQSAAWAIGQLRDNRPEVIAGLSGLLEHQHPDVRLNTIISLGLIGPAASGCCDKLEHLAGSDTETNRQAAQKALSSIRRS